MPLVSVEELADLVPDGALVALPPDNSLVPNALVRALIRAGRRALRLLGVPVSGYATDLLIGAGCVAALESSGVTLGEAGVAPRFLAALKRGTLAMTDATCPAIHTMLQAAEKGVPFMPLRGILGSDLLAHRPDWKVINNPFAPGADPIVLLPALAPDVAIFHAMMADDDGNVHVGRRHELATVAHAARRSLVTVERMSPRNLLEDEHLAAGTIAAVYVEAIAIAERGAWPLALLDEYAVDSAHLAEYARLARSDAGFGAYLDRHVFEAARRSFA
ncbi:MAG: CoA synthetase [Alphaproteobacteria bacterium]|nr:CoA synthetase [Alphaproteobacteria bacterium]